MWILGERVKEAGVLRETVYGQTDALKGTLQGLYQEVM